MSACSAKLRHGSRMPAPSPGIGASARMAQYPSSSAAVTATCARTPAVRSSTAATRYPAAMACSVFEYSANRSRSNASRLPCTIMPSIHNRARRRARRRYNPFRSPPPFAHFENENGIDAPLTNRKSGMIKSHATKPSHSTWSNWLVSHSGRGLTKSATNARKASAPPMIQSMSNPRSTSIETRRFDGAAVGVSSRAERGAAWATGVS